MKWLLPVLAALLLTAARPLTAPALPPAVVHVAPRAAIVHPQPPSATPGVTISGDVYGMTSGGSAPIGAYTAYGDTLAEATQHAQQLEAQIRMTATEQHVTVTP